MNNQHFRAFIKNDNIIETKKIEQLSSFETTPSFKRFSLIDLTMPFLKMTEMNYNNWKFLISTSLQLSFISILVQSILILLQSDNMDVTDFKNDVLSNLLKKINEEQKVFLLGDFNIDLRL